MNDKEWVEKKNELFVRLLPYPYDTYKTLTAMVEQLRAEIKRLNDECRHIDANAAIAHREHEKECEQLKSDYNKLLSMVRGYCKICKHLKNAPMGEPCRNCNKVIKQNYEFKGLEVQK